MSRFLEGVSEQVNVGSAEEIYHADLTTNRIILDDNEIATVFGMEFANSSGSAAEVTVTDGVGSVKFTATMPPRQSVPWPVKFLAEDGLIVEGLTGGQADDVFVSVFYTAGIV